MDELKIEFADLILTNEYIKLIDIHELFDYTNIIL